MSIRESSVVGGLGRKLLIVAMASTFGLGLAGCNDDNTSVAGSGGGVTDRVSPKGTVVGQVVDNSGNPLSGVNVSIPDGAISAKALVTTGADGQFSISNVVVCEVADAPESGAGACDIPLNIDGPTGFLNAIVTISPKAQISNAQPGGDGAGQTNPQLVFIDGFTASAGVIPLPKTGVAVTGVLRDADTGAPIVGQNVVADFRGYQEDNGANDGAVIRYGETAAPVNTGADGSFTIPGLAEDSCYALAAQGLDLEDGEDTSTFEACNVIAFGEDDGDGDGGEGGNGAISFSTRAETGTFNLGLLEAEAINTTDRESPFVLKVGEVIPDENATTGELTSSFTDTFNITFSEALAAGAVPVVRVTTAPSDSAVQTVIPLAAGGVNLSGNVLTVKTSSPIGSNLVTRLFISIESVRDPAGNVLSDGSEIRFDSVNGRELQLLMRTANAPTAGLTPVTLLTQITDAPANSASAIYASSSSLIDVVAPTPPYNQLNAPAAVDSDADLDGRQVAFTGLDVLLEALQTQVFNPAPPQDVSVDTALVGFTTSGARRYAFALVHADGSSDAPDVAIVLPAGSSVIPGDDIDLGDKDAGGNAIFYPTIAPSSTSTAAIRVAVSGAVPGDILRITSIGLDGNNEPFVQAGAFATLPLVDHVAPTVGAQSVTIAATRSGAAGPVGTGGGLVMGSMVTQGTVIYPVTPQLYDRDDSDAGYSDDELDGATELEGLSSASIRVEDNATQYDATGAGAFLAPLVQTIGVNVTEPLNPTATQPLVTLAGGTTVFTMPGVINDSVDENGDGPYYLYTARVDSVEKLQADARSRRVVSLRGIIDANNVPAADATRAVTQLRDFTPPVMTRAFYDGQRYIFQFNEPVRRDAGFIVLQDCGVVIDLNAASDPGVTGSRRAGYGPDHRTLVVPASNPEVAGGGSVCFPGDADGNGYNEAAYSFAELDPLSNIDEASVAPRPLHGVVRYDTVQDETDNSDLGLPEDGNSWAAWSSLQLGVTAPTFYGANVLAPIQTAAISCVGFTPRAEGGPATTFSCDVSFSHPLLAADFADLSKLQVEGSASTGAPDAGYGVFSVNALRSGQSCTVAGANTNQCNGLRVTFMVTAGTAIDAGDRVNLTAAATYTSNLDASTVGRAALAPNRSAFRNTAVGTGGAAQ